MINAVHLPSCYLITPEPSPNTQEFLDGLERSLRAGRFRHPTAMDGGSVENAGAFFRPASGDTCAPGRMPKCGGRRDAQEPPSMHGGIRLVQLRAKTLSETAYAELARQVLLVCHAHQAQLILNAAPALVEEVGADGVHLDSARLMSLSARPFLSSGSSRLWVGASCHNAKELAHAGRLGADFAVVSPVLETASHPGALPLGWTGFRDLTELAVLPVYALGGMTPRHVTQAYEHGAQGIAGISSLWRG